MRPFLLSAIATATVIASTAVGLSTDANAASRRHYRQAPVADPVVRQAPSGPYDTFAPSVSPYQGRRDVNPISGTPRWNAAGGAA
jgi:hypothetical protein